MTARDPLAVECPYCGAVPYAPCRYRKRRSLKWSYYSQRDGYHAARVRAAEREKEEKK